MARLGARLRRLWRSRRPAASPAAPADSAPPAAWARRHRWQLLISGMLALLLAAIAVGESLGWPFLAAPLERALSARLGRRVSLTAPGADPARPALQLHLLGSVRLRAPWLEIAAPPWSAAAYTLQARDMALGLNYGDLWRAYRGAPLRIDSLQLAGLQGTLERLADGRSSWQLPPAPGARAAPSAMPAFGRLQIDAGSLRLQDALQELDLLMQLSLREGPARAPQAKAQAAGRAASGAGPGARAEPPAGFELQATGRYRRLPLRLTLSADRLLPGATAGDTAVTLELAVGRAHLNFDGQARGGMPPDGLTGRFALTGPSLAAVGDLVGVTLPSTGAFRAQGRISEQGRVWQAAVSDATVGSSHLSGDFRYDASLALPRLSGSLRGTRLMLVDLGPVVGAAPAASALPTSSAPGRLLPDRPFDLPSLRAMDADLRIDIAEVDLNTPLLEPLRPLRAHLQLAGGVLRLSEIEARTGQGRLIGALTLDGRGSQALWRAALSWDAVQLEHWVRQARARGAPPYLAGTLRGRADLRGQGRSTAEILASLSGDVRTDLRGGRVSHLAVEAAGVDIAEIVALLVKGDDALTVQCAVADLRAEGGVLRPRVAVLDTEASAVWLDGSLSLAREAIDLRLLVVPKDFSPLSLRAPLRVGGSFSAPRVSIDKAPLARKLGAALLLALVNPIAAVMPLIDPGDATEAARGAAACYRLQARLAASIKPPPAAAR